MENFSGFVVFIHVICGSIFAIGVIAMQTVLSPAMSKIPAGEDKQKAAAIIAGRAQPAMDTVIIIQTITAIFLIMTSWDVIAASHWMHVKVTFGILALTLANLLHFYWRGKKRRLKADGKMDKFKALARRTLFLEKIVLVSVIITFVMGAGFNHL